MSSSAPCPDPAPRPDPAEAAFNKAIREFKIGLKNEALYSEILATTSADQVYDLTDALQKDQTKANHLRNLAKIQPYLNRLEGYCGAIDTFVQAKPEILALVWGPVKLLLQWASNLTKPLDALINTLGEIGRLLPEFRRSAEMFGFNDLLALFFQDMLDFYLITLKFFEFQAFFEALWPKRKQKIEGVIDRITRHTTMLRNDVRLEHIQEEYNHRASSMEHFENLDKATRRTEYGVLERNVAPTFYDAKLDKLRGSFCKGTGSWLLSDTHMGKWLEATEDSSKAIWLRGIPGAGKTFLAAGLVDELRSKSSAGRVIFTFLSHALRDTTSALSVIHSLIFQLTRDDSFLQDVVCEVSRGTLCSDLSAATDILIKLLPCSGRVHIIIDGLDEVDEKERVRLLEEMLRVSEKSDEARILVSCRAEHDLKALLQPRSTEIRVDTRNMDGIQAYVTDYYSRWFQSHDFDPEEKEEFVSLFSPIAGRAKGMFMYARLILKNLEYFNTIDEVRDELRVLPTDLDDAYGRIFSRVNEKLPSKTVRDKARRILGWIGCSPMPMTIQELEQALSIRVGDYDQIPKGYSTLNIVHLCGPVVEVVDDEVQFVHFTAKQYFFSRQIANSLDTSQYTLGLAQSCITYLCQAHHDPHIDEIQFERYLVAGVYRLHHFATGTWFRLIELYFRSNKIDIDSLECSELFDLLRCMLDRRVNAVYIPSDVEPELPSLKLFKNVPPEVYNLLYREALFHQKSAANLFKLGIEPSTKWLACQLGTRPMPIDDRISSTIVMLYNVTMGLDLSNALSWAASIIEQALRANNFGKPTAEITTDLGGATFQLASTPR
ncbi:related to NACHT domain protein [Cephalotrichum gorgonifer]|uniref:Related to NACHT domain protein n=1 Tax=Cephalotrichum gorgonifer TaxID=2041049 RepID=A0AAE8SZL1_9PEZI|nr:related to NACHT domain protein [Cephalotrichum gorgonifer]